MVKIGMPVHFYDDRYVQSHLYISGKGPYAAIVTHVQGDGEDNVSANLVVFMGHMTVFQDEVPMCPQERDHRHFMLITE